MLLRKEQKLLEILLGKHELYVVYSWDKNKQNCLKYENKFIIE